MGNDAFRRAIVHALDPAAILRDDLARGKTPPGVSLCNVVFASSGSSTSASAAGETTADPAVAKVLVEVARVESAARDPAAKSPAGMPQIILSHPADDVARIACLAIQRQLRSAGFTVVLQETSSHEAASTADADLQYVEWMPLEPVVGLEKFLDGSAAGERALEELRWPALRPKSSKPRRGRASDPRRNFAAAALAIARLRSLPSRFARPGLPAGDAVSKRRAMAAGSAGGEPEDEATHHLC